MSKKLNLKLIAIIAIVMIVIEYLVSNYNNEKSVNNVAQKSQFSIGVNIHFVEPNNKEVNKLHEAGFSVVRMDFFWSDIEIKKGVYDFSKYDKLVKSMNKNNIKILFILDYSSPLYDNGLSPYSDNGRKAFANFAKHAVEHYKGNQVMWEIWNEPNIDFWKPKPNADKYLKLAIDTIKAIRSKDTNTFIVAPAVAGLDYSYLNYLGKNGLFKYINALSVHPYRRDNPEKVIEEYNKLRNLIQKYPHNKNMQVFSSEWGYSTSWNDMTEMKQAQYGIREYLTNIMCGVELSIWYDWKNDGNDTQNPQDNFGTVYNNLEPKPIYYAIKTMTSTLKGYRYIKRINCGSKDDYELMFEKGNIKVYALWTIGKEHNISINLSKGKIEIFDLLGNRYEKNIINNNYNINISESVKYVLN
jgi:hypothetical protein